MVAPQTISVPGTCECALFGKRVFADVIKNFQMRTSWIRWALNPASVPRGEAWRGRDTEKKAIVRTKQALE